ncbi:cytochrome c oxidase assembly protein [Phenylobacterium sp. VNQ135]|uniref:cytochrome c oxidase assembly protein n=1 Tax=Phenylobacterium sp. VNQ135 TaxID=3400922 RepID=UPI003C0DEA01
MRGLRLAFALAGVAGPAAAHVTGTAHAEPGWTFDPLLTVPLVLSAALFGIGAGRIARRSTTGRAAHDRRAWLFVVGWLSLAASVVSPLHEAGERSFTAHMVEHEILMLVAAPLLVLSRPLAVMLWALPAAGRQALGAAGRWPPLRQVWRVLNEPVTATLLQAAALWIWHVPALFDLALRDDGWHIAQHLSFFVSALFFWSAMLEAKRRGYPIGLPAVCLFVTSLVAGALGALMALSESPWYARYAELGLAPFGLTPVEDQQLAGLLMWVPGGLVHAGAALALVGQALRLDRKDEGHAAAR